jgi:hypothetical protein
LEDRVRRRVGRRRFLGSNDRIGLPKWDRVRLQTEADREHRNGRTQQPDFCRFSFGVPLGSPLTDKNDSRHWQFPFAVVVDPETAQAFDLFLAPRDSLPCLSSQKGAHHSIENHTHDGNETRGLPFESPPLLAAVPAFARKGGPGQDCTSWSGRWGTTDMLRG